VKTEILLPVVAAILTLAALFVRDGAPPGEARKREAPAGSFLILAALVVAIVLGALGGYGGLKDAIPLAMSFGVGCLLSALAYGLGLMKGQAVAGRAAPIALGTLAPAALGLLPYPGIPFAMVFGAAAAAWFLSIGTEDDPNPWAMRSAVVAALVVAMNMLGKLGQLGDYGPMAGTILGLTAAAAAVLGGAFAGMLKTPLLRSGIMLVILAGGWYLIDRKLMAGDGGLVAVFGGVVLAFVVDWLVPEGGEANSLRMLVASVIWISAGTAAFGFDRGFGISALALSAAAVLLTSGNRRALLTLGPLGALVMYRVFRESHLEASKAFDIGQHYAMIGLLVGALLPVMAVEWLRSVSKRGGFFALIAGALWVVLMLAAPVGAAIMLGAKGVVGYLFGLGLASVIEAVRGERSAHAMSLGIAMAGTMSLVYEALTPYLDLERAEKLSRLAYLGGGIVVLGVLIAVLSGEFTRSKEGNA